jgi:pilus assembly protein Flp/PilA
VLDPSFIACNFSFTLRPAKQLLVGTGVCGGTKRVMGMLRRFFCDDRGSNALEYGLIVGLISLAIAAGASATATQLNDLFNILGNKASYIANQITS